ncbi:DUF2167 domain-containing protein [Paenibacillus macerans]|nr:DUF2167 domain-containing protein [Paenibacillus macerans]MCY7556988.1 DUF2167 domain-containing protein [Paenibacillus macerans]MDU5948528.1 DUF2167 domain-containing protein [Paenibacillus macerans]MEC0137835.1 DUF2167 domain-containing protein [Paenibacillus macerans]MEC0154333.1 DUF2167 domain-containing protein [Paenibacillus macerans]MEC0330120.1 DUF2167 domain-containing protein [Paenibacillus macerans]
MSDPANLNADRKVMEAETLPVLTVNAGQTYNDYDPATGKKPSAGLTGLILGGAGLAVAKKAGLLHHSGPSQEILIFDHCSVCMGIKTVPGQRQVAEAPRTSALSDQWTLL